MNRRDCASAVVALLITLVRPTKAQTGLPGERYRVDASAGTVTDTRTGLIWKSAVSPSALTWEAAKSFCAGLGGGFRLPGLKELLTLVDPTRANPCIDQSAFPGTPSDYFWTASPDVDSSGNAWVVGFYDGTSSSHGISVPNRVRCVR
ncbi:MAG: hypothetical protein RL385_5463 [Pseudomonadota bacterium]